MTKDFINHLTTAGYLFQEFPASGDVIMRPMGRKRGIHLTSLDARDCMYLVRSTVYWAPKIRKRAFKAFWDHKVKSIEIVNP